MSTDLVKIDIFDDESLLKACDILHDGYCDLSNMKYDETEGTWRAFFEREFFENPELMKFEARFIFFHRVTFPMARTELFFEGVKTFNIVDKSYIQIYSFNECQIKNKSYTFFFNEDMEMIFTFEGTPKGHLVDQELLDKTGSLYQWRNPFKKLAIY